MERLRFSQHRRRRIPILTEVFAAVTICFISIAVGQESETTKPDPVTEAIGKNALAFVEAFNTGDAAAIAKMFTESGEMSVDGEPVAQGRQQIQTQYAAFFNENLQAVISVHIESIRKLGPGTVIEKGISEIINDDDDSVVDSYTAIHVNRNDKWQTVSVDVRQEEVDAGFDWRAELGKLAGKWEARADSWKVTATFEWSQGGNFLKRDFERYAGETLQSSGVQVIGWDPLTKSIRSWVFGSDGGHGGGFWSKDGNQWVVESEAVTPEGEVVVATNIFTMLNEDELRWQSVNRSVSGAKLENTDPIRIKRVK